MEEYIGAPGGDTLEDVMEHSVSVWVKTFTGDAANKKLDYISKYSDLDSVLDNPSSGLKESKSNYDNMSRGIAYNELLDSTKVDYTKLDSNGVAYKKPSYEFIYDFNFGKKESEGKLFYELDFDFIKQMAERMATNKGKYLPYNWKKPIDVEYLKQATFRHILEVMEGRYEDDGREFGHIEAIADNMMMLNYQLKNERDRK